MQNKTCLPILIALIFCSSAMAQTPAAQITTLSEQTTLLQAQQAHQAAELKLMTTADEIRKLKQSGQPATTTALLSVAGIDGKLVATLQQDDMLIQAKKGDLLRSGWKVSDITPSAVMLQRGKRTTRLNLGQTPTTAAVQGATAAPVRQVPSL